MNTEQMINIVQGREPKPTELVSTSEQWAERNIATWRMHHPKKAKSPRAKLSCRKWCRDLGHAEYEHYAFNRAWLKVVTTKAP